MPENFPPMSSICTTVSYPEELSLQEITTHIQNLDGLDNLPWEDSYVSPTDLESFELLRSNSTPKTPDRRIDRSVFEVNYVEDGGYLHVHSFIEGELFEEMVSLHDSVLIDGANLTINHGAVSVPLPFDFSEYRQRAPSIVDGTLQGVEYSIDQGSVAIFGEQNGDFISFSRQDSVEDADGVGEYLLDTKNIVVDVVEEINL